MLNLDMGCLFFGEIKGLKGLGEWINYVFCGLFYKKRGSVIANTSPDVFVGCF